MRCSFSCRHARVCFVLLLLLWGSDLEARPPGNLDPQTIDPGKDAEGIFVLDGSFVHNVGELQLNITNWGLLGSTPTARRSYSNAPSAMWPAGSGVEYLYGGGLWVGAIVDGEPLVSTGYPQSELLPSNRILDTLYSMVEGEAHGLRFPAGSGDDDEDGEIDEDPKNGVDDDQDGLIDEDYAAISDQHFRCMMRDDTPIASAQYPDHDPMGIEVVQETHQWTRNELEDVVVLNYTVTNVSNRRLESAHVGLYVDPDIGPREGRENVSQDDMVGFLDRFEESGELRVIPTEANGRAWFNMAYMYDCDGDDQNSPGYIGFMFINVDRDLGYGGNRTPSMTYTSTFRWFAGTAAFDRGGDPTNDTERYDALSGGIIQEPPEATEDCGFANDYRLLIASSVGTLSPQSSVRITMAMVMGQDLEELQSNAAEVMIAYYGSWFDYDRNPETGIRGREHYACESRYGLDLFKMYRDCPTPDWPSQPTIRRWWLDGNSCLWINGDCSFEKLRGPGTLCWSELADSDQYRGCSGVMGKEYNVLWYVGSRPPLPPRLRIWETHERVHLFWDNLSESSLDDELRVPNFESYRVWRAAGWDRPPGTSELTGPATELWQAVAEYDVVDSFELKRVLPGGGEYLEQRALGENTGLEAIRYVPAVLRPDSREASQFRDLRVLIDQIYMEQPQLDGESELRYRDASGQVTELGRTYPALEQWDCCYDQLDTLQADRFDVEWYEYIDRGLHDGFHYFHGVSATAKAIVQRNGEMVTVGPGQEGAPVNNFIPTLPGPTAQTREERAQDGAQIYVIPNPATSRSLDEFSALFPNADDPTGRRVEFRNLPAARNLIRVFTLAGDLVAEIQHDGSEGYGSASWNLVSRNGQQVVSGIYLYSVESADSSFQTFVGRFVILL